MTPLRSTRPLVAAAVLILGFSLELGAHAPQSYTASSRSAVDVAAPEKVASAQHDHRPGELAVQSDSSAVSELDVAVHTQHLAMLDRLAESGVAWAHVAREPTSPLLYVSASGFTDRFRQAATASRDEVHLWTLEDLYQPSVE
jgi:hypothetical protein